MQHTPTSSWMPHLARVARRRLGLGSGWAWLLCALLPWAQWAAQLHLIGHTPAVTWPVAGVSATGHPAESTGATDAVEAADVCAWCLSASALLSGAVWAPPALGLARLPSATPERVVLAAPALRVAWPPYLGRAPPQA